MDESLNTITYLLWLREEGWLRHHEVLPRAYCSIHTLAWDTHFSARIRQFSSGAVYCVDSWHRANGAPPYIQNDHDWFRKHPLQVEVEYRIATLSCKHRNLTSRQSMLIFRAAIRAQENL